MRAGETAVAPGMRSAPIGRTGPRRRRDQRRPQASTAAWSGWLAATSLELRSLCREANDLATAAVRAHPERLRAFATLPTAVLDASYRGLEPRTGLALATFGWGWHLEAGLSALRLILRGTFDRHPDLQVILGNADRLLRLG
jgi:hypothetical protein